MYLQTRDKLLVVLVSIIVLFVFVGCQKNENNQKLIREPIKNEETVSTDEYEAKLYYDGDHFVLSVFTNIIEKDFSFTYDNSKFLLDDIGASFENAKFSENEDEKTRTCTMEVDSNSLYEFNFIKLGKEDMKIGKNLKIN